MRKDISGQIIADLSPLCGTYRSDQKGRKTGDRISEKGRASRRGRGSPLSCSPTHANAINYARRRKADGEREKGHHKGTCYVPDIGPTRERAVKSAALRVGGGEGGSFPYSFYIRSLSTQCKLVRKSTQTGSPG